MYSKFFFFLLLLIEITSIKAQESCVHKGIYAIYENLAYQTELKQSIPSSGFTEMYTSTIISYPSAKLGFSYTAWGNLGLTDWTVWGVDIGAGLSYSKSIMNADPASNNAVFFENPIQNNQTFFNFYQTGNQCQINDVGINIHVDAGTILYGGIEIDAGPSGISFTDNRIQNQQVKSTGWFTNVRVQSGISIPCPFIIDSKFKLNIKAYAIIAGWSARYYKLDWISDDKKLKNFSVLETKSQPFGAGFSLTFLLNN